MIGHVAERAGLLAIAEHSRGLVGEREIRRRDARNRTAPQRPDKTARKSPIRRESELDLDCESVMATPRDQLLDKIGRLSPEYAAEVEDFVDFLFQRDTDRRLVRAAAAASEPAFAKVWDNPEDDVYNTV